MFCIIVVHFTEMLFFQECACQFVGFMHENETKDINSILLFETNKVGLKTSSLLEISTKLLWLRDTTHQRKREFWCSLKSGPDDSLLSQAIPVAV